MSSSLRSMVLEYLHALQEQGVQRLPVDEEARTILRSWMLAARRGSTVLPPLPAAPQASAQEKAAPAVAFSSLRVEADSPAIPPETEQEEIPFFRPGGENPEAAWQNMQRLLPTWEPLRSLGTLREKAILPQGNIRASIMFVGDAPGYADEKQGLPFCGEAGGKLDGMLKAMGLTRREVYLTQLLKFRPAQPRQTLNTRPPTEREIRMSLPVLDFEIRLVHPRVIVALGVIAARGLLQRGNLPLAAYQEQHGHYRDIPVIVTHHPSYLLRTSDLAERRRLWEEMLRVMEMAQLPISEKQRGFFLPKK
ncbi:MAG: uracil-DNA glycosylase [Akkermansia sp.]|nr:uracil-DNA glycosylase [Akkermansia sp.]